MQTSLKGLVSKGYKTATTETPHREAEGVEDGFKAGSGDLPSKLHQGSGLDSGLQ